MRRVVADLHLHSKYSRAVSQEMVVSVMGEWARKKGIDLLGTGDITHPLWLRELRANLEEAGEGVFKEKGRSGGPLFVLAGEISSIYSQGGKVRRIHNLVVAPSFETVEKINLKLTQRGCNLLADGRPVVGLSSMELCELVWEVDERVLVVPCHVWTPWFSLYGSRSGFDSLGECFGEFADRIYGIETGLSSDPGMNWRIAELDKRSILSFSDAHSPAKLGREATVLVGEGEFGFSQLAAAVKQEGGGWRVGYTIEFYPEEGKYHYTGHRKCGVRQSPEETKKLGTSCPVCGKPLTLGVMHRVEELASRQVTVEKKKNKYGVVGYFNKDDPERPPYVMLVPLLEVLAEALGSTVNSQRVLGEYEQLTSELGGEFGVLLKAEVEEIRRLAGERVAEAVRRVREGEIVVKPGYDGVFGEVSIWPKEEEEEEREQMSLF